MLIEEAYAELGLARGAPATEVKRAWRQLVSQWHPDRNASSLAVSKMQRLNQAYELLRDLDPPQQSAQTKQRARPHRREEPAPNATPQGQARENHANSDTHGAERPSAKEAGADAEGGDEDSGRVIQRKVRLSLEEAAAGCMKVLRGRIRPHCHHCRGQGWRLLGDECEACAGSGEVRQRAWFGFYGPSVPCEACHGDGRARSFCAACDGRGKLPPQEWQVKVRIPHGARDGDVLHVDSRQAKVKLNLLVKILPHPIFKLGDAGAVHCEIPVDGFAWVAQRHIEVPSPSGRLQTLAMRRDQLDYRLIGQGFPTARRGAPGDLWVRLKPLFPERLSTDQEILIDKLLATQLDAEDSPNSQALRGWREAVGLWSQTQAQP